MESNELLYAKGVLVRLAQAARSDRTLAQEIRALVTETRILEVFGQGEGLDVRGLLDAGGPELLRAQLGELTVAQLRQVITSNDFDPEKASTRWRSTAKLTDLIVTRAVARQQDEQQAEEVARLERELQPTVVLAPEPAQPEPQPKAPKTLPGAAWML